MPTIGRKRRVGTQSAIETLAVTKQGINEKQIIDSSQLQYIRDVKVILILANLGESDISKVISNYSPEEVLSIKGVGKRSVERLFGLKYGSLDGSKKKKK